MIAESLPRHYFTFPLDDPKGIYMLNYDGDYWLTYYEVKTECDTSKKCYEVFVKKGNTSITETPVDLKQYLDTPVLVRGEFMRTRGGQDGAMKQYCIKNNQETKCIVPTGPGIWYASPLKIWSMQLK